MLIILALIGAIAAAVAWFNDSGVEWLIGALLLASMFPLTGIFIVPTNLKLLKVDSDNAPEEAALLLKRWGQLHAIRTVTGSLSFVLFVYTLTVQ